MQCRKQGRFKESDARESQKQDERVGCMKPIIHRTFPVVGLFILVFSFVSTGVCQGKRTYVEEKGYVSITGRVGGGLCYGLYILLSLPLVS